MSARVSGPENSLIQIMNLLNWSVPPPVVLVPLNVLLPLPAAVVVVALPPVLVLGFFVVFLLPVLFFAPAVVLFFFTANVEAVILPAVTSAIAVTITKIANSVVLVRILGFYSGRYYRFCLRRLVLYMYISKNHFISFGSQFSFFYSVSYILIGAVE